MGRGSGHAWPPLENGPSSAQLRSAPFHGNGDSPGGRQREDGSEESHMAGFPMARFPCLCFLPLLQKKKPLEEAWGARSNVLAPSQSLTSPARTLRSQVFISVPLKLIGKVNEINMAKRCALLRRKGPDTCCPRGNYGPVHSSWGRFIELSSSKTWLFLLDNSKVGCIQG